MTDRNAIPSRAAQMVRLMRMAEDRAKWIAAAEEHVEVLRRDQKLVLRAIADLYKRPA